MEPIFHQFKHDNDERYIANQPWRIARAKGIRHGQEVRTDGSADSHCICRSKYKLDNVDPTRRSPKEVEEWDGVLEHAEKQARLRAVQMHLNVITTPMHFIYP